MLLQEYDFSSMKVGMMVLEITFISGGYNRIEWTNHLLLAADRIAMFDWSYDCWMFSDTIYKWQTKIDIWSMEKWTKFYWTKQKTKKTVRNYADK